MLHYSFPLCNPPSEFYDSGALMMEEEGAVMGGLLVGLNVIDANLCIKGEDLDSQVSADRSRPVFSMRNKSIKVMVTSFSHLV